MAVRPLPPHDGAVDETDEDPLERLRRWEEFGAAWEVVHTAGDQVTVSLRRCDGGEEVGRIVSSDPRLRAHVER